MIEIGICEDQRIECELIESLLKEYASQNNLKCRIDMFSNGLELLRKEKNYDILFLDVDMPVINGIELGKKIRRKNRLAKIIYVTGYADYAFRAFSVHAFDYLIKPVSREHFQEKFAELIHYINLESINVKLYFKKDTDLLCFKAKEIYYFEAVPSHKIRIITDDGVFEIRGSIDQTLEQVEKHGFSKAHKSYIVNLEHIVKIESYRIFLENGVQLPLAERAAKGFKDEFNLFLQRKLERDFLA